MPLEPVNILQILDTEDRHYSECSDDELISSIIFLGKIIYFLETLDYKNKHSVSIGDLHLILDYLHLVFLKKLYQLENVGYDPSALLVATRKKHSAIKLYGENEELALKLLEKTLKSNTEKSFLVEVCINACSVLECSRDALNYCTTNHTVQELKNFLALLLILKPAYSNTEQSS